MTATAGATPTGTMTNRERVLAILDGKSPDQVPWIPRLEIWYRARQVTGTMPPEYQGYSLRQLERALGVGTPARGGRVFRIERPGVETVIHRDGREIVLEHRTPIGSVRRRPDEASMVRRGGNESVLEYRTPVGSVRQRRVLTDTLAAVGIGESEVDYFLKEPRDYDVLEYIAEHTYYRPAYEEYLAYEREIGDDGYPMTGAGDCPFHHFLRQWAGYERSYLELADHPDKVEHLLTVTTQVERERLWPILEESPARMILHGVHLSSHMTPPPLFRKYITPYYQEFSARLHAKGKRLVMHADNDTRLILQDLKEAGYDMLECFATWPLTQTTLAEARAALGTDVSIWGAIPSVLVEPGTTPEDEFERYLDDLFRTIAPGDAVILGVADNVMPEADIGRIARITELVNQRGRYPIQA